MSLIFVDGFDHYTNVAQKWTINTQWADIAAGYARNGAGGLAPAPPSTSGPGKYFVSDLQHATFIVGLAMRIGSYSSSAANGQFLTIYSGNFATRHISLAVDPTGKLTVLNNSDAILGQESGATFSTLNVWRYVEVKVTLSATGQIEMRVDGKTSPEIQLTNVDTTAGSADTVFDSLMLCRTYWNKGVIMDDLYVCNGAGTTNNDFLGDVKIETLRPSADGANSALTPSTGTGHAAMVDETAPNTSDFVSSATADAKDTWGYGDLTSINGSIKGVQVNTYAQKSDTGARSLAAVTRHAGVDYDGVDQAVGQGFAYTRQVLETNPGTSTAWTVPDVNNAEFGVKVRP